MRAILSAGVTPARHSLTQARARRPGPPAPVARENFNPDVALRKRRIVAFASGAILPDGKHVFCIAEAESNDGCSGSRPRLPFANCSARRMTASKPHLDSPDMATHALSGLLDGSRSGDFAFEARATAAATG